MLLAIDIGNTNIKIAVSKDNQIIEEFRISTDSKRTGDEYFVIVRSLLKEVNINSSLITKSILSSVVPSLIGAFVIVCQRLINKKPIIIAPDIYKMLPVKLPESAIYQIGTDLLSNATEAWCRYKCSCIVVDFGTALSFTAIDDKANIQGVAIAPGINTGFKALFNNTAQLASVPLEVPSSSLGKTTTSAIQSGMMYGYKGLIESLINQMKNDLNKECNIKANDIKVIATGGLNSLIQPITNIFDIVDKKLTINGIIRIANFVKE